MKLKFEITNLLLDYRSLFSEALKYIQDNPEYGDVRDHVVFCLTLATFIDKQVPPPGQVLVGGCMVHAILEELGFVPVEKMDEDDLRKFDFPYFEAWAPMEIQCSDGIGEYNVYDVEGFLNKIQSKGLESSAAFYTEHSTPLYLLEADEDIVN